MSKKDQQDWQETTINKNSASNKVFFPIDQSKFDHTIELWMVAAICEYLMQDILSPS